MDRFGFNQDPKLDYPERPDDRAAASATPTGACSTATTGFDVGRVAIGQGGAEGAITVSPLQMAEVAAAVGNGGKLMKPRLTDRIVRKDGRVKQRIEPDLQAQVMKPETAEAAGAR